MTDEDKQFVRSLIDKTNFFPQNNEKDDDIDFTVEEVNIDPPSNNEDVDEIVYVKTVSAPSEEKPLHPKERLRQKVKKIRQKNIRPDSLRWQKTS